MACPLSQILNDESKPNEAPRTESRISSTAPQDVPTTPSSSQPKENLIDCRPILSPFKLARNRGDLYARRQSRSPQRLATPPDSDPVVPNDVRNDDPPTHEMDFDEFNIFKAIISQPELTFEVARHLDIEDLVSLYAISKDFHRIVNSRFTTTILSQSLSKAPESSRTFLFKSYRSLCIVDPAGRPNVEVEGHVRRVPSLRWLRMVLYREDVVNDIIDCLAAEGHRLPKRASLTLKKIWFVMDIAANATRIALMHNREFWTDQDLHVATHIFVKLDMRFTDPVDSDGETTLRRMLLGQRSLTTMWKALKRTALHTRLEVLQMYVRWKYRPHPHLRNYSILGVPAREIGRGDREGWGKGSRLMLRPDDLVMREAAKRDLGMGTRILDMMLWGYVDPETLEDIPNQVPVKDGDESALESDEGKESERNEGEDESNDEVINHEDVEVLSD
ncbi:MAG: hypothetical protein M1812_001409 [Candelaria pacifica]|nr:MAG: hypothetical protein M1812_001409 [Candelaria pacifica]